MANEQAPNTVSGKDRQASKANGASKDSAPPPSPRSFGGFSEIVSFLWQNAERLRGVYKPNEYDKVILPLLVIRRLDCALEPTKAKVLAEVEKLQAKGAKLSHRLTA